MCHNPTDKLSYIALNLRSVCCGILDFIPDPLWRDRRKNRPAGHSPPPPRHHFHLCRNQHTWGLWFFNVSPILDPGWRSESNRSVDVGLCTLCLCSPHTVSWAELEGLNWNATQINIKLNDKKLKQIRYVAILFLRQRHHSNQQKVILKTTEQLAEDFWRWPNSKKSNSLSIFLLQNWQVLPGGFSCPLPCIQYYLLGCLPPVETLKDWVLCGLGKTSKRKNFSIQFN